MLQCKLVILIVLCGIPQFHSYYSDAYLITYVVLTYLLTYLLHGAESS